MPARRIVSAIRIFGFVLFAGVTACSKGQIDFRQINAGYAAGQYHWIPYNKSMMADVSGNPFAIPQDDFNSIISKAIQAKGYIPTRTGARVRMVFNGATGGYICGSSGDGGTAMGHDAGGRIRLAAAYCSGGSALTYAIGSIDNVSGPDDPDFLAFVRNMTVYLFPSPGSTNEDDRCKSIMGC